MFRTRRQQQRRPTSAPRWRRGFVAFACFLLVGLSLGVASVDAEVQSENASERSLLTALERQVEKVWQLARETTGRIFNGQLLVAQVSGPAATPAIVSELLPSPTTSGLAQFAEGNLEAIVFNTPLQVAGPFSVSGGLSALSSTTINGTLTVIDDAVVGGQLSVGQLSLQALSVSGQAQFGGPTLFTTTINAAGGLVTDGADVDVGEGSIFASNIVNTIQAGDNITITGTSNQPIISVDDFAGVTSLNGETGDVDLRVATTFKYVVVVSRTTRRSIRSPVEVVVRGVLTILL